MEVQSTLTIIILHITSFLVSHFSVSLHTHSKKVIFTVGAAGTDQVLSVSSHKILNNVILLWLPIRIKALGSLRLCAVSEDPNSSHIILQLSICFSKPPPTASKDRRESRSSLLKGGIWLNGWVKGVMPAKTSVGGFQDSCTDTITKQRQGQTSAKSQYSG